MYNKLQSAKFWKCTTVECPNIRSILPLQILREAIYFHQEQLAPLFVTATLVFFQVSPFLRFLNFCSTHLTSRGVKKGLKGGVGNILIWGFLIEIGVNFWCGGWIFWNGHCWSEIISLEASNWWLMASAFSDSLMASEGRGVFHPLRSRKLQ